MNDEARVEELRRHFPVARHWAYFHNGSIHPCPRPVGDAMRAFIAETENGGEAAWPPAFAAFGRLRERFAALIHARPGNIVVTESTSAAINLAAGILRPKPAQNVVLNELDFMTNTYPWLASHPGVEVRFVPSRDGKIATEDLAARVDGNTAAIGLCAVTVGSGFRFNLHEVAAVARQHGTPLIVDGAQALGVVDIDVNDPPIDFLATTTSKWLMGPTGVGLLYVSDRHLSAAPPAAGWLAAANVADWDLRRIQLHADATRFQGGMLNLAGIAGALAGLEFLQEVGREFVERRVRLLTTHLIGRLDALGVDIWTPRPEGERAGIVFFRPPGPDALQAKLRSAGIYCGHFLGGIRVDPTFYNTMEELERLLRVVEDHVGLRP